MVVGAFIGAASGSVVIYFDQGHRGEYCAIYDPSAYWVLAIQTFGARDFKSACIHRCANAAF
jgi:hypothetical protein